MGRGWNRVFSLAVLAALFFSAAESVSSEPGRAGSQLDSIAHTFSTLEQLAQFLHARITFQGDLPLFGQEDYWQTPEELLARGRGDCEDYALLARDLLSRRGMEAFLFSLYGSGGYAHTVCVFRDGGGYSVMNQDRLVRYRAATLEDLAGRLYWGWEWGAVAERQGHRGRAVRIILRNG